MIRCKKKKMKQISLKMVHLKKSTQTKGAQVAGEFIQMRKQTLVTWMNEDLFKSMKYLLKNRREGLQTSTKLKLQPKQ